MKSNINMTKDQAMLAAWTVTALLTLILVAALAPEAAQNNIVPDANGQR